MNEIAVATALGVSVGLAVYYARKGKQDSDLSSKITALLADGTERTVPELALLLGMKDSFMNCGKIVAPLRLLIGSKQVVAREPAGCTMKTRLRETRYRTSAAE